MSKHRLANYIVVGVAFLLSAAVIVGCSQPGSDRERAASVLTQSYSEIPALDNEDTVLYDDVTPEFVLTYAENQTEDYPTTQAAYRFAQLVNIRTEGRIQIRVYADAELGDELSTIEQMRIGGIDLTRVSLSLLTDYNEESIALMMPYIYRGSSHMWDVLSSDIGDRIKEGFSGSGFTPLAWYDAGVRNLYFRTPVQNMDDMQGLRIRVQSSAIMEDMIRQFGAIPVPTDYESVYSSLELENVDGAENSWSSYDAMAHNEVASYFMLDEHMRIPEMQLISDITVSLLSDADMEIIRQCAEEAAGYECYLWDIYVQKAELRAVADGTTIVTLTDEERQAFQDAVEPLYEEYCGDFLDLIEAIREMK